MHQSSPWNICLRNTCSLKLPCWCLMDDILEAICLYLKATTQAHIFTQFTQLHEVVLHVNGLEVGNPSSSDATHEQSLTRCFPWNVEASQCSIQVLLQQIDTCRGYLASLWVVLAWFGLCLDCSMLNLDASYHVKVRRPQRHQHIYKDALFPLWHLQELCWYYGWS